MNLETLLRCNRTIRVIGFDDAPFERGQSDPVSIAGVVCAGTRFEGMVWGQITANGWDAADQICRLLQGGKFLPQTHLILLDGISMGGFNLVNLPELAQRLERPCVAVMRRYPRLPKVFHALERLPQADTRRAVIQQAGEIYAYDYGYFQVAGAEPTVIAQALPRLTAQGLVPEALRLAHLVGSAVIKGESGRQA